MATQHQLLQSLQTPHSRLAGPPPRFSGDLPSLRSPLCRFAVIHLSWCTHVLSALLRRIQVPLLIGLPQGVVDCDGGPSSSELLPWPPRPSLGRPVCASPGRGPGSRAAPSGLSATASNAGGGTGRVLITSRIRVSQARPAPPGFLLYNIARQPWTQRTCPPVLKPPLALAQVQSSPWVEAPAVTAPAFSAPLSEGHKHHRHRQIAPRQHEK